VKIEIPEEDGIRHYLEDIAVLEDSVYITGMDYYQSEQLFKACYWKDGVKINLPVQGTGRSDTYGIIESDGSIYIAGAYNYDGTQSIACYWKDGVRTDLLPMTQARAITTFNGSIYIAGNRWYGKDGVINDLTKGTVPYFYSYGIAVSENAVYIAGSYRFGTDPNDRMACYWKNGTKTDLLPAGTKSETCGILVIPK
jgi:hypothetical protein